ncbi:FAD/NAD(P)-binding domain-containing protein [Backusella circina FSU 941]|nr:FAD/NAD(P)-binding domain-containing protein [Backusella circina FSU 941]
MKLSRKDLDITLIDCKTFYEYTPALCSVVFAKTDQDCRSHFYKITAEYLDLLSKYQVKFILGKVRDIQDDDNKGKILLTSGESLDFDYVVITTGSTYADPWKAATGNEHANFIDLKARSDYIIEQRLRYKSAMNILCIGGGPVGVETAAEIAHNAPEKQVILVDANEVVLANAPGGLGNYAQRILTNGLSIRVINGESAELKEDLGERCLYETDKSHTQIEADLVYNCIGAKPNSQFLQETKKSWLNDKKEIEIDDTFLVKGTNRIFALGDVCSFNEPKMFFTAHMQAIHFVKNMTSLLQGKDLVPYRGSMMAMVISLGPERAIAYVGGITLSGFNRNKGSKVASLMKYVIERVTMNDLHLKLMVNEVLYLTHEKGHFVPRAINKCTS